MQEVRNEVEARDMSGSPSGLAKLWIGLGLAFAVIALVFFPPLFGGLGILFGYLAKRRGSKLGGVVTMYISGAAMVLGMVMGVLVYFALLA